MSRKEQFVSVSERPAEKYLEWASEQGKFKYYDKAKGENVFIDLPRFLVLAQYHTVKGWNDASQSAIWSNEVKIISTEEMEVKAFKGGVIAKGVYKDIKERVQQAGGHYTKSIYIMVEGGEVWNLQIKGAVVQEWGEVFNKCQQRFADEWVTLDKVDTRKKGRVTYTVPVFKFNGVTSDEEAAQADAAYDKLHAALKMRADERNSVNDAVKNLDAKFPADPLDIKGKVGNIEGNFIEDAISDMDEDNLPF
jgi:hypothetical protein